MNGIKNISINKKRTGPAGFLLGFIALLIFLTVLNFFSAELRNAFFAASLPVEKQFWTAGESVSGFFLSITKSGLLKKENSNLKEENQKLLSQIIFLQAIKNANQAQSDVSMACQNSGFQLLMAGVVGSAGDDELTINKGLEGGISEGMPVINQQGVLFGKILKVYKNFSSVMLISNRSSVVNVRVLQDSDDGQKKEIDGVIKGRGGLEVFLDLVPVDDTLKEGDVLVTSSLEGSFPKDILVGKVEKVEKNDQNPHQQAKVQPFLDIATDNLFIVTNYKR